MIAVFLSRLAIMPMHPCAAFENSERQSRRRGIADGEFHMMTMRKQIIHPHVGAPDVANDIARLGASRDFLHENALVFVLEL